MSAADGARAPATPASTPVEADTQPAATRRPAVEALYGLYPSLRVGSFRLLWLGMLPATFAFQMSTVAVGYAAFALTGAATTLGLVSLAQGFPMAALTLVGGVAADRLPRRTTLIVTQCMLGLVALGLALLAISGQLAVWHLVVASVLQGLAFAFNMPSRQALIGTLVGPRLMRNAVALNNAGMNFSRIAGPSLAGAILAAPLLGLSGVFIVMTLMFGIVVASLFQLPAEADARPTQTVQKAPLTDLVEGVTYVAHSPTLRALLLLALAPTVIGMPFQTLLPLFADHVFDVGAVGLGTMMACVGVGALLGAIFVATAARYGRPALLQLGLGTGFGLALIGFALSPWYLLALAMLVLVGFSSAAYMALNNTLIMGNSEPRFYGRVMSIYQLTFGAMPLGSVPASWLADALGGRETVAITGSLVALVVLGVAVLYRPFRTIT